MGICIYLSNPEENRPDVTCAGFDTLHFPHPENRVFPPVGGGGRKFENEKSYLPHE